MHKGVIILTKAGSKDQAEQKVRDFMEDYQDQVWDWYQIGGRWQGTLAPMAEEFHEKAMEIIKPDDLGFVSQKVIKENNVLLQEIWESLGGEGRNPFSDHYSLPDEGGTYDIMPLKSCLKVVKDWQQNKDGTLERLQEGLKRHLGKEHGGEADQTNFFMLGFDLKDCGQLLLEDFCFETNVFNMEHYDYSIPEDPEGYYAVMVDMHN
jgi:hypothetical protein